MKPRIRLKRPGVVSGAVIEARSADTNLWYGGGATAHFAASDFRNVRDWQPGKGSADSDLLGDHDQLVARSRDLDRNNGVARGGLQTIVDNVVGTGLRLTPRPNYRAIGWTKEQADEWSQKVFALWLGWADTTACDAADSEIFDSLTAQTFRSWLCNGEALALPLWIPGRGDSWATKLLTIEADRLSNPDNALDSDDVRAGIRFDKYGQPIGYYIRNGHPGDYWSGRFTRTAAQDAKWSYVARRGPFGRMMVLHCFDRDRPGQSRGKPLMASIMREFKQQDRYVAAEIDAAVANSMIAATITTPMDQESIEALFSSPDDREYYLAKRKEHAAGLSPGSLIPLFPGDQLQPFLPSRPATGFASFVENVFRIMGVGMDLPYELLLKDFSKSNYSSARAAMLEAWRSFNRRRDSLGTKWGDPIYGLWLEEGINDGRIEGVTRNQFYANRAAFARCRWIGPGRGWVDEVKEITAAKLRIDSGISTLEEECARQGVDWREVAEQRATERDFLKQLGFDEADAVVPGTRADPNVARATARAALAEDGATVEDEPRLEAAA